MFATVTPHQSAVSGKKGCRLGQDGRLQHGLEDHQVCKAKIPGVSEALDVENAQGPDVPPAPMVPVSLHDPYELRTVVGTALVKDGSEPRVAVERVRDACEHTSLVKALQAPCNLGRVQQLIGKRRTVIHKVHCHCPCAPSHHLKVLGVCVCNGSRRDVCCGGRLLQPLHQPVDLVDPLERVAVHSCIMCGDALAFLQSLPVSGR
jgi:hypothetical protein